VASKKHKEYIQKLMQIGNKLGYITSPRFSKDPQGDVIWFSIVNEKVYSGKKLPIIAFEVLCSETPKSIKGSIATLQHISPSLGILVVIDEEYAKKAKYYKGYDFLHYIKRKCREYTKGVKLTSRIEVWDQKKVDKLFEKQLANTTR